jgi:hypothetical protein
MRELIFDEEPVAQYRAPRPEPEPESGHWERRVIGGDEYLVFDRPVQLVTDSSPLARLQGKITATFEALSVLGYQGQP